MAEIRRKKSWSQKSLSPGLNFEPSLLLVFAVIVSLQQSAQVCQPSCVHSRKKMGFVVLSSRGNNAGEKKKRGRLLVELFVLGKWAHDRVSLFFPKWRNCPGQKHLISMG